MLRKKSRKKSSLSRLTLNHKKSHGKTPKKRSKNGSSKKLGKRRRSAAKFQDNSFLSSSHSNSSLLAMELTKPKPQNVFPAHCDISIRLNPPQALDVGFIGLYVRDRGYLQPIRAHSEENSVDIFRVEYDPVFGNAGQVVLKFQVYGQSEDLLAFVNVDFEEFLGHAVREVQYPLSIVDKKQSSTTHAALVIRQEKRSMAPNASTSLLEYPSLAYNNHNMSRDSSSMSFDAMNVTQEKQAMDVSSRSQGRTTTSTVLLSVQASNVPQSRTLADGAPLVCVFAKTQDGKSVLLGQTERVSNTENPVFDQAFCITSSEEEGLKKQDPHGGLLIFCVYYADRDDSVEFVPSKVLVGGACVHMSYFTVSHGAIRLKLKNKQGKQVVGSDGPASIVISSKAIVDTDDTAPPSNASSKTSLRCVMRDRASPLADPLRPVTLIVSCDVAVLAAATESPSLVVNADGNVVCMSPGLSNKKQPVTFRVDRVLAGTRLEIGIFSPENTMIGAASVSGARLLSVLGSEKNRLVLHLVHRHNDRANQMLISRNTRVELTNITAKTLQVRDSPSPRRRTTAPTSVRDDKLVLALSLQPDADTNMSVDEQIEIEASFAGQVIGRTEVDKRTDEGQFLFRTNLFLEKFLFNEKDEVIFTVKKQGDIAGLAMFTMDTLNRPVLRATLENLGVLTIRNLSTARPDSADVTNVGDLKMQPERVSDDEVSEPLRLRAVVHRNSGPKHTISILSRRTWANEYRLLAHRVTDEESFEISLPVNLPVALQFVVTADGKNIGKAVLTDVNTLGLEQPVIMSVLPKDLKDVGLYGHDVKLAIHSAAQYEREEKAKAAAEEQVLLDTLKEEHDRQSKALAEAQAAEEARAAQTIQVSYRYAYKRKAQAREEKARILAEQKARAEEDDAAKRIQLGYRNHRRHARYVRKRQEQQRRAQEEKEANDRALKKQQEEEEAERAARAIQIGYRSHRRHKGYQQRSARKMEEEKTRKRAAKKKAEEEAKVAKAKAEAEAKAKAEAEAKAAAEAKAQAEAEAKAAAEAKEQERAARAIQVGYRSHRRHNKYKQRRARKAKEAAERKEAERVAEAERKEKEAIEAAARAAAKAAEAERAARAIQIGYRSHKRHRNYQQRSARKQDEERKRKALAKRAEEKEAKMKAQAEAEQKRKEAEEAERAAKRIQIAYRSHRRHLAHRNRVAEERKQRLEDEQDAEEKEEAELVAKAQAQAAAARAKAQALADAALAAQAAVEAAEKLMQQAEEANASAEPEKVDTPEATTPAKEAKAAAAPEERGDDVKTEEDSDAEWHANHGHLYRQLSHADLLGLHPETRSCIQCSKLEHDISAPNSDASASGSAALSSEEAKARHRRRRKRRGCPKRKPVLTEEEKERKAARKLSRKRNQAAMVLQRSLRVHAKKQDKKRRITKVRAAAQANLEMDEIRARAEEELKQLEKEENGASSGWSDVDCREKTPVHTPNRSPRVSPTLAPEPAPRELDLAAAAAVAQVEKKMKKKKKKKKVKEQEDVSSDSESSSSSSSSDNSNSSSSSDSDSDSDSSSSSSSSSDDAVKEAPVRRKKRKRPPKKKKKTKVVTPEPEPEPEKEEPVPEPKPVVVKKKAKKKKKKTKKKAVVERKVQFDTKEADAPSSSTSSSSSESDSDSSSGSSSSSSSDSSSDSESEKKETYSHDVKIPDRAESMPAAFDSKAASPIQAMSPHMMHNCMGSFQVSLRADNLIKMDMLSDSDPMVRVYARQDDDRFLRIFQSEEIENDHNPVWQDKLRLTDVRLDQILKIKIYDVDSGGKERVNNEDLLGMVQLDVARFLSKNVVCEEGHVFEKTFYLQNPFHEGRNKKMKAQKSKITFTTVCLKIETLTEEVEDKEKSTK